MTSLIVAGLVTAGCSHSSSGKTASTSSTLTSPSSSATSTGSITVFAAASLTNAFTKLGKAFEAAHPGSTVRFSFGPSSGLAQQIIAAAPADLFASASAKNMKQVTDAGDATGPRTFAKNVAEIAVAPASATRIKTLADLSKGGVKIALCQPQVPCGALASKVLAKAKVTVKPVTQGLDVKSTLAYVTNGQVDAAIVYVTDVLAAGSKVTGVQIPEAFNTSTAYEIAPVKAGTNTTLAQAFEDYVLSDQGQAALAAAGFTKP
jgi:molybdate transport system substrate-binding protein